MGNEIPDASEVSIPSSVKKTDDGGDTLTQTVNVQLDPERVAEIVMDRLDEDSEDSEDTPETVHLPTDIARYDEDLFKRIANYLGREGHLDRPNRTTHLTIEVEAGGLVRVTDYAEDADADPPESPEDPDGGGE